MAKRVFFLAISLHIQMSVHVQKVDDIWWLFLRVWSAFQEHQQTRSARPRKPQPCRPEIPDALMAVVPFASFGGPMRVLLCFLSCETFGTKGSLNIFIVPVKAASSWCLGIKKCRTFTSTDFICSFCLFVCVCVFKITGIFKANI